MNKGVVPGEGKVDYLRVLVIDDSLTIRAMFEELVERQAGCRVVGVAATAAAARSLIIDLAPNVITLDLNMPGLDGLSFLDELRDQPHAPIVVVSSSTRDGGAEVTEALAHGADACFDKGKVISEAGRFIKLLKKASQRKFRRSVEALQIVEARDGTSSNDGAAGG
jgi:chemotaxis response regulator CheB